MAIVKIINDVKATQISMPAIKVKITPIILLSDKLYRIPMMLNLNQ